MTTELEVQAKEILDRLGDSEGSLFFHVMAIQKLGFQLCYELASYALQMRREGHISRTVARYYNGCVMKEIRKRRGGYE